MSLARMGRISVLQHQLSAGLQVYQKVCSLGDRLIRRNRKNSSWITELATNENWVVEILLLLNSYDDAADACALIIDTVKTLPDAANSDLSWLAQLSVNLDDAASLIVTKGKPDQALRIFQVARGLRQQMVQRDGANQDIKCDLALGFGNIASLLVSRGDPMEALTVCQQEAVLLNALDSTPANLSKAHLALRHILPTY